MQGRALRKGPCVGPPLPRICPGAAHRISLDAILAKSCPLKVHWWPRLHFVRAVRQHPDLKTHVFQMGPQDPRSAGNLALRPLNENLPFQRLGPRPLGAQAQGGQTLGRNAPRNFRGHGHKHCVWKKGALYLQDLFPRTELISLREKPGTL